MINVELENLINFIILIVPSISSNNHQLHHQISKSLTVFFANHKVHKWPLYLGDEEDSKNKYTFQDF